MSQSLDDVETIKHPTDYVECVSEFFQNSSSQQELYPPSVVCESVGRWSVDLLVRSGSSRLVPPPCDGNKPA